MTANPPTIDAMTRFIMKCDEYETRIVAGLLTRNPLTRVVNCGGCGCGEYSCKGCYCQCDNRNCGTQHAPVSESESDGSEETEEEEEDDGDYDEEDEDDNNMMMKKRAKSRLGVMNQLRQAVLWVLTVMDADAATQDAAHAIEPSPFPKTSRHIDHLKHTRKERINSDYPADMQQTFPLMPFTPYLSCGITCT
jgi:hypothetical protein